MIHRRFKIGKWQNYGGCLWPEFSEDHTNGIKSILATCASERLIRQCSGLGISLTNTFVDRALRI